jgi:hypothetical protein
VRLGERGEVGEGGGGRGGGCAMRPLAFPRVPYCSSAATRAKAMLMQTPPEQRAGSRTAGR